MVTSHSNLHHSYFSSITSLSVILYQSSINCHYSSQLKLQPPSFFFFFSHSTTSPMPVLPYTLLEGPWPLLQKANPVPEIILDKVLQDANGNAITNHIGYFSLGFFYIDSRLLVPHSTQRPLNNNHVNKLYDDFCHMGIFRTQFPGVVIGLGEGWNHMHNTGAKPYKISISSPHLHHLSKSPNGPIAEIIRGNHRTEAIRRYSHHTPNFHENFWYYNVLLPGMSSSLYLFYFILKSFHYSFK